jgi:hypothetical protein
MGRCFSLFGMMVFTMGVVALASLAGAPPAPARREPSGPARPRPPRLRALAYHAPFSLN